MPSMQALVAMPAPVFIGTDVLWVADCNCADSSVSTLLDDIF
jgi:hypothetical protein